MATIPSTLVTRSLMALAIAGAVVLGAAAPQAAQAAQVAQQKVQVPGFYRIALGEMEVTALYDGFIDLDATKLLKNATPKEIQSLLAKRFQDAKGVQTAVNAYLVNTGANLVLVDAGSAKC